MKPAFFLMGPTASGKTALAIELASRYPFEIISVDSAMIYRGMDLGTNKPTACELKQVPHHLIDLLDPSEAYSVAQFCQDAKACMDQITRAGKIPLLVGGTMLYFKALQFGLSALPEKDPVIRDKIAQQAQILGWPALHRKLEKIDPIRAQAIHPNDPQRIQRALEIYACTGIPPSQLCKTAQKGLTDYHIRLLARPVVDRAKLHQAIETRFQQMLDQGFIAEVEALFKRPDLHAALPAMRCVGYRQAWAYLSGEMNYKDMHEKAIAATRQLAKRQLTWLRGWEEIRYVDNLEDFSAVF